MPITKISEYSATAASNTDINGIDIAEGCAPSGINDAIRTLMKQIKDLQAGTSGDTIPLTAGGTGATTASAARTALGLAIGTNVQAYDLNLTTFVNVFTLPTADGTANQVLKTDGSGVLGFAAAASGDVTTTGTQTLTNKTISGASNTLTVDGTNAVGFRSIPNSGAKTSSYTLVAADVGKIVELGSGGSIVVPASVFAAGDVISIFNNTSASISCTCSAVTDVYKAGTNTDISSFSVTTRGVATILFITTTVAVVTGNLA
jgi:hypothetical protein